MGANENRIKRDEQRRDNCDQWIHVVQGHGLGLTSVANQTVCGRNQEKIGVGDQLIDSCDEDDEMGMRHYYVT